MADGEALDRLLVKLFLESHGRAPETVWLDLDATDDPLHGGRLDCWLLVNDLGR